MKIIKDTPALTSEQYEQIYDVITDDIHLDPEIFNEKYMNFDLPESFLSPQGGNANDRCLLHYFSCHEMSANALKNIEFILSLCKENNLSIDKKDWHEMTALHYAASHHHLELAALLLDAGANPNAADNEKLTPLHYALYVPQFGEDEEDHQAREDMARLLMSKGASITPELMKKYKNDVVFEKVLPEDKRKERQASLNRIAVLSREKALMRQMFDIPDIEQPEDSPLRGNIFYM